MSMFFVFAAMVEFAVVLVLKQKIDGMKIRPTNEKGSSRINVNSKETHLGMTNGIRNDLMELREKITDESKQEKNTKKYRFFDSFALNSKIDFVSFCVFIMSFSVFNCIYWNNGDQIFPCK